MVQNPQATPPGVCMKDCTCMTIFVQVAENVLRNFVQFDDVRAVAFHLRTIHRDIEDRGLTRLFFSVNRYSP